MTGSFSLAGYRSILAEARDQGYQFRTFTQQARGKTIYLRHDVDYSPLLAREIARENQRQGIVGTFFLLLRSQIYNVLSPWNRSVVEDIVDCGQRLALHAVTPNSGTTTMTAALQRDHAFLAGEFQAVDPVFAWHTPSRELLDATSGLDEVASLRNAYGPRFTKDCHYLADSVGRHPPATFIEALRAGHPRLQYLLHPYLYVCGGRIEEVLAKTWRHVIREREAEMLINRRYQQALPHGLPDDVLDRLQADVVRCLDTR